MENSNLYSSVLDRYFTVDEFELINDSIQYLSSGLDEKKWNKLKKKEQYVLLGVAIGSQMILESVAKGEADNVLEQTKRGLGLIVETEDIDE